MNNEIIGVIVKAVMGICVAIVTTYVIPWLKSKIGENNYQLIVDIVTAAVEAAEKKYTPEQWAQKKDWVLQYAVNEAAKHHIDIDINTLDTIIESAVYEVK